MYFFGGLHQQLLQLTLFGALGGIGTCYQTLELLILNGPSRNKRILVVTGLLKSIDKTLN